MDYRLEAASQNMKVILGIATFQDNDSVVRLCSLASQAGAREVFSQIQIVDSLGHGLAEILEAKFDQEYVRYFNHSENLGAAGNLEKRLQLATEAGGDFLFALNADGHLDLDAVVELLEYARESRCGAVYPIRKLADNCYEITGTLRFPWRPRRLEQEALSEVEAMRCFWSSSNGALYGLEPATEGILPPIGLWHGFEDLAYGLLLDRAGYRQVILPSVQIESRYEVMDVGKPMVAADRYGYVSDKPSWLAYYTSRNLLLIATRIAPGPLHLLGALIRISLEVAVTLRFRERKLERLRHLARGLLDGVLGRQGRVLDPSSTV